MQNLVEKKKKKIGVSRVIVVIILSISGLKLFFDADY